MEAGDLEKRIELGRLIDFYGPLITEHRLEVIRMYVEEDMSFGEIAEVMTDNGKQITRQGAYDALTKAEKQLAEYENKLGLIKRYDELGKRVRECIRYLDGGDIDLIRNALKELTQI